MLLHPTKYADLLSHFIEKHQIKVWLINTGWYGGGYGVGERFPLSITRDIVRAIQNHELDQAEFSYDEIFKVQVPTKVRKLDSKILLPRNAWKNPVEYESTAKKLAESFDSQLKKINNA
jgi:phosphoenolpyruvate carboxykinase (ATP)